MGRGDLRLLPNLDRLGPFPGPAYFPARSLGFGLGLLPLFVGLSWLECCFESGRSPFGRSDFGPNLEPDFLPKLDLDFLGRGDLEALLD